MTKEVNGEKQMTGMAMAMARLFMGADGEVLHVKIKCYIIIFQFPAESWVYLEQTIMLSIRSHRFDYHRIIYVSYQECVFNKRRPRRQTHRMSDYHCAG